MLRRFMTRHRRHRPDFEIYNLQFHFFTAEPKCRSELAGHLDQTDNISSDGQQNSDEFRSKLRSCAGKLAQLQSALLGPVTHLRVRPTCGAVS